MMHKNNKHLIILSLIFFFGGKNISTQTWLHYSTVTNNLNYRDLPAVADAVHLKRFIRHVILVSPDQGDDANLFDDVQSVSPFRLSFFG